MKQFLTIFKFIFVCILIILIAATSVWQPTDDADHVRAYTRSYEFDYLGWTLDALWHKITSLSLGPIRHMTPLQQRKVLREYFQILSDIEKQEESLTALYADPLSHLKVEDQKILERDLENQKVDLGKMAKLAEAVLQDQIGQALVDLDLTFYNQAFPPILYRVTDLPKNLVISPRDIIRQEKNVSLVSGITLNDEIMIESEVEENTDFSALVVPVGGVSTYPTMVIRTGNLMSLLETVAHEWVHNYLIFRPLGVNYSTSSALRTMNETTASIAGDEISEYVIRKFYSDLMPINQEKLYETFEAGFPLGLPREEASFDFRKEMYETRLRVDELLGEEKIDEAEAFMETRRKVFWENGYRIRKLNQAYFAFHGAYADQPFSAAGADPVGEDVRILRARSRTLAEFVNTMSWLSSYQSLKDLIHTY